jgi:Na+-driven multidrug efflux pump
MSHGGGWARQWKHKVRAEEPFATELAALTVLLALGNVIGTLPNLVERSRLSAVSSADVAAASLLAGLVAVPFAFAQSVLAFTVTPIARAVGRGEGRMAVRLAVQNLWLAVWLGGGFLALAATAGFLVDRPDEVYYLRCVQVSCFPLLFVVAASTWLTAHGAGTAVLAVNSLWCAVQVAWSMARIPDGGLVAAGQARLLAGAAAGLLALLLLGMSRPFRCSLALRDLWPDRRLLGDVWRSGVAHGVCICLTCCVPAGFLYCVEQASTPGAAAVGIGFGVYGVITSGLMGLSQAVQALGARRLGEGRPDLQMRTTWLGLWIAMPLAGGTALLLWAPPAALFRLACGGEGTETAASLALVFAFLGVKVFGEALYATFAAALRSTNRLGFLCGLTAVFGAALLGGSWLALQAGAGLPTFLSLLCLYVFGQAVATFFRYGSDRTAGMRTHSPPLRARCRTNHLLDPGYTALDNRGPLIRCPNGCCRGGMP